MKDLYEVIVNFKGELTIIFLKYERYSVEYRVVF